jgi:hypothetical protein
MLFNSPSLTSHRLPQWGNSILMIISRTGHYDLLMALLESDQTLRIDFHYQNPVSELVTHTRISSPPG